MLGRLLVNVMMRRVLRASAYAHTHPTSAHYDLGECQEPVTIVHVTQSALSSSGILHIQSEGRGTPLSSFSSLYPILILCE
jgi:hypothetical protein